ncbi:MAG: APC family permease [Anaerolineae bacterium]|nr:APC family permease [Anaerolineae bacterium]
MSGAEKVFARRASGLVRGLSLVDALGVAIMNIGVSPSMFFMISVGLLIYPGGNLIIAAILGFLLGGISFPLVWGILGGSMPRSGGEYVYNSRILGPVIAVAESFGNAWAWILWITTLAPYVVNPGLTMLFGYFGLEHLNEAITSFWGLFLLSSLVNVIAFLLLAFGMKFYAKAQRVAMAIGLLGTVVCLLVLTFTTHDGFVASWNALAAKYGSLDYNGFLQAAKVYMEEGGAALPSTWNWPDTIGLMIAGSWLIIYSYAVAFIAGEVKRPDKTLLGGSFFACLIPTVLMIWCGIVLYQNVGYEFTVAASYVDGAGGGLEGYTFPWSTHFMGLAAVLTQNPIILGLFAISFIAFSVWFVAMSYLAFPRILFAWGMDRVGPKWFTDINHKTATPIKTMALLFVIGEILLVPFCLFEDFRLGFVVTTLEVVSVFGVTAISAVLFAHRKQVKNIWEASPYKNWKLFGIPVITLAGILNLIYLAILFYGFFFTIEGFKVWPYATFAAIWILGILWYFYWKKRNSTSGIDVSMAFEELPPD